MGPFDDILGVERKTAHDVAVELAHGNVFASVNGERAFGLFGGLMWDANSRDIGGYGQSHWLEGAPCERTVTGSFVRGLTDPEFEVLADLWTDGFLEVVPGTEYSFGKTEGARSRLEGMTWDELSTAEHEESGDVLAVHRGSASAMIVDGLSPDDLHPCAAFGVRVSVPFDNVAGEADLWVPESCLVFEEGRECPVVVMPGDVPFTVDLDVHPGDAGRYDANEVHRLGPAEFTPAHRFSMTGLEVAEHVGAGGGEVRVRFRDDQGGAGEFGPAGAPGPEPAARDAAPTVPSTWMPAPGSGGIETAGPGRIDVPAIHDPAAPGEVLDEVPRIEPDWFPGWDDEPDVDAGFEPMM